MKGRHRNPLVIRQLGSFHYRCFRLFHDPLFRRTGFNQHIDCCGKSRVVLDGPCCNPRFSRHLVGGFCRGARFLGFVAPLLNGMLISASPPMRLLFLPIPCPPLIRQPIGLLVAPTKLLALCKGSSGLAIREGETVNRKPFAVMIQLLNQGANLTLVSG